MAQTTTLIPAAVLALGLLCIQGCSESAQAVGSNSAPPANGAAASQTPKVSQSPLGTSRRVCDADGYNCMICSSGTDSDSCRRSFGFVQ
jgi:hypothetical protein